jgi:hypothetical protein
LLKLVLYLKHIVSLQMNSTLNTHFINEALMKRSATGHPRRLLAPS